MKCKYLFFCFNLVLFFGCHNPSQIISDNGDSKGVLLTNPPAIEYTQYYSNGNIRRRDIIYLENNKIRSTEYYNDGEVKWEGEYSEYPFVGDSALINFSSLPSYIEIDYTKLQHNSDTVFSLVPNAMYRIRAFVKGVHPHYYGLLYKYSFNDFWQKLPQIPQSENIYEFILKTPNQKCEVSILYVAEDVNGVTVFGTNPQIQYDFVVDFK